MDDNKQVYCVPYSRSSASRLCTKDRRGTDHFVPSGKRGAVDNLSFSPTPNHSKAYVCMDQDVPELLLALELVRARLPELEGL